MVGARDRIVVRTVVSSHRGLFVHSWTACQQCTIALGILRGKNLHKYSAPNFKKYSLNLRQFAQFKHSRWKRCMRYFGMKCLLSIRITRLSYRLFVHPISVTEWTILKPHPRTDVQCLIEQMPGSTIWYSSFSQQTNKQTISCRFTIRYVDWRRLIYHTWHVQRMQLSETKEKMWRVLTWHKSFVLLLYFDGSIIVS